MTATIRLPPVVKSAPVASVASPSLQVLGVSTVSLLGEISFTCSPFGKRLGILPYDFFGNQTAAHPVVKVCACS